MKQEVPPGWCWYPWRKPSESGLGVWEKKTWNQLLLLLGWSTIAEVTLTVKRKQTARSKSLLLPLVLQFPFNTLYWQILTGSQMAKEKFLSVEYSLRIIKQRTEGWVVLRDNSLIISPDPNLHLWSVSKQPESEWLKRSPPPPKGWNSHRYLSEAFLFFLSPQKLFIWVEKIMVLLNFSYNPEGFK